jgi:hypothetical protein
MKSTKSFKNTIQKYLENRAQTDELFAPRYANPEKNIDDCINYILGEVKKSGCNGFADEEIYSMAVHYYDELDLKAEPFSGRMECVVNHVVELTDEEKADAKQKAIENYHAEQIAALTKKTKPSKPKAEQVEQPSLFG